MEQSLQPWFRLSIFLGSTIGVVLVVVILHWHFGYPIAHSRLCHLELRGGGPCCWPARLASSQFCWVSLRVCAGRCPTEFERVLAGRLARRHVQKAPPRLK